VVLLETLFFEDIIQKVQRGRYKINEIVEKLNIQILIK